MNKKYKVHCKYCGHVQDWSLKDGLLETGTTMDDVIEYDLEYMCNGCGCGVRVSEALEAETLEALSYE